MCAFTAVDSFPKHIFEIRNPQSFEQEFDSRLDVCMQQIMSHKLNTSDDKK